MGKPIRDKKGKFAGSEGAGKKNVPTSAKTGPSKAKAVDAPDNQFTSHRIAREKAKGRELVVGSSLKECRNKITSDKPAMVATFRFPKGTSTDEVQDRLRRAGFETAVADRYGAQGAAPGRWVVSTEVDGSIEVESPLLDRENDGWQQAQSAQKALRGSILNRGVRANAVEVTVGDAPPGSPLYRNPTDSR